MRVLAQSTLVRFWRVSEERRDRMKRRESVTRRTRFKQNGSWSSKKIPDFPCLLTGTAVEVSGHQRMRERGEGCIPMDSIKQKYCLETLGQMVPLTSHNHSEAEMRVLMNSLALYRKKTNNSEGKAETAPFLHTLDSTACK